MLCCAVPCYAIDAGGAIFCLGVKAPQEVLPGAPINEGSGGKTITRVLGAAMGPLIYDI